VKKSENRLLYRLIVKLPCGPDLACEQRSATATVERPQVLAVRRPVDPEEVAN
jgi:hypothetical protein